MGGVVAAQTRERLDGAALAVTQQLRWRSGKAVGMEIIDLSLPIAPSPPETPDPLRTEIEFSDHVAGATSLRLPRACPKRVSNSSTGSSRPGAG